MTAGGSGRVPWTDAVGYQVYVPSFMDGNGDGMGDLSGLTSRLPYLRDLGVTLLWLSPIHPSPLADHWYDIDDFTAVDPRLGTLSDVDALVAAADDFDVRVLLDLVPNHTSVQHEWFRRARSSRENPYRNRYFWRNPAPDGGPPNNWVSALGGPAWTLDETTGQYYLHLFHRGQPDLNWRNRDVVEAFDDILRFWLDRGIAGFRVDVPHVMIKHADLPDNPLLPPERIDADVRGMREWDRYEHRYDFDQPDVIDPHRRWKAIAAAYDAVLIGEVNITDPARLRRYTTSGGLDGCFWFRFIRAGWQPEQFAAWLHDGASVPGAAWVLSSHDRSRAVTRYGGGAAGRRRALTLATLMIGLPTMSFLYQGDELGLDDAVIKPDQIQDPLAVGTGNPFTRDAVRTPMPWTVAEPNFGFSTAPRTWQPLGDRRPADTVSAQLADVRSPLHAYRALLALRNDETDLRRGAVEWLDTTARVIAYRCGQCVVAANVDAVPHNVELPESDWQIVYATDLVAKIDAGGVLRLPAEHAVVLRRNSS